MTDNFLTPEDYEIAEKNGISRELAYSRFYNNHWEKERAITQPKRGTTSVWKQWKEVAEANGIRESTFYSRLNVGLEPEEAATKEVAKNGAGGSKHFSDELLERAATNGITPRRLYSRVFECGWDIMTAVTTPLVPCHEAHKYKKSNKYKEKNNLIALSKKKRKERAK